MFAKDFIGEGIAYPLTMDSTGRLALVSGVENVERSMRLILGTAYGERPMRPDFGCGIHDLVFEAASPPHYAIISHCSCLYCSISIS